ncbi:LysM peptidoglycan-binding domain-containing protein [Citrifermentans bremense]|uniref:LysM peptidoglycan-binding domain-containing protein n=1 Tax=Citrifermentans bremense TaxID=60035 RepID=UPI000479D1C4|nr:LysM peptidoglycan-binding domain-containing protein [Citrifermentans bremense]
MTNPTKAKGMLLLALLSLPCQLHAAPPQYEIDLKELDRQKPAPAPKPAKKEAPAQKHTPVKKEAPGETPRPAKGAAPSSASGEYVRYTVKPGDHIFKILMVNFGMSNEAAERLTPEIVRINNISNIKALTVGRTLLIPAQGKQATSGHHPRKEKHKEKPRTAAPEAKTSHEKAPAAPSAPAPQAPEAAPRAPEPAPRAPEPAPAPRPAEPAPAAPAAKPAPALVPVPAPAVKAPAPASVPAPAAPAAVPAPPAVPQAATWVCPAAKKNTAAIVDSLLNALSTSWSKSKIIHSGSGAPTTFSIRVDRYFEYKGARYVISIGESDPYNYTLIRLLEAAGYRVLMLSGGEDFKTTSEKLFKLVGIEPAFGNYPLSGGNQAAGYLLQQEDAGGRRVLLTEGAPPPGHKWVLPLGCGPK